MSDKIKLRVDLSGKEDVANKVTSISSSSTNTHYPTAKAVYDAISEVSGNGSYITDYYSNPSTNEIILEYTNGSSGGSGPSVTVDSSWISNSTNPVQSQLIKTALDNKANQTHTHTKSQITDFPTIPTKVSDLQNDSQFITSNNIVDNLNSTSNTAPLSARQGKELADMIGNILTIINGTGT